MNPFESLGLSEPLRRAVVDAGYTTPTPIQAQTIPALLAARDLLGCAQTGSGKTAAFALPTLQRLAEAPSRPGRRPVRALVLAPTRELAAQIHESFHTYGRYLNLKGTVIYGGVGQGPQVAALRAGVDILVATPGRLLDLCDQGLLRLDAVEIFVLDEADRMLDMGFIQPIRKVISMLPAVRQNLLFSATMPGPIAALASGLLRDPVRVDVEKPKGDGARTTHALYSVGKADKARLLVHLLQAQRPFRCIVFTRTKHGANRLTLQLEKSGLVSAAIHGNKSQGARTRALQGFISGDVGILVATDIAARGIDIDDIDLVVNYDLPDAPETFVHRVGRTARAGRTGAAIAFCDEEETGLLADIERLLRQPLPLSTDQPFHQHLDRHARPQTPAQLQSERVAQRQGPPRRDRDAAPAGRGGAAAPPRHGGGHGQGASHGGGRWGGPSAGASVGRGRGPSRG